MIKKSLLILLGLFCCLFAQAQKRPLTIDEVEFWNRITSKSFSQDSKSVAVTMTPWVGDAIIELYDVSGNKIADFEPAVNPKFAGDSKYLLFTEKLPLAESDALKLKKAKLPSDKLVIFNIANKSKEVIEEYSSYKLSDDNSWLAYKTKDNKLVVRTLDGKSSKSFEDVSSFVFAGKENKLAIVAGAKESNNTITTLELDGLNTKELFSTEKSIKNLAVNNSGDMVAFVAIDKNDKSLNSYSLFLSTANNTAKEVVSNSTSAMTKGWIVNGYAPLQFSKDSELLFFGTSPAHLQKDTTILAENRPNVHLWSWDEKEQYTSQNITKNSDLKKSYLASLSTKNNKMVQLANEQMPNVRVNRDSDQKVVLVSTNFDYAIETMWRGRSRMDYYLLNVATGQKELIKKAVIDRLTLSPTGKYITWYSYEDFGWHSYSVADKKEYVLTTADKFVAHNEAADTPDYKPSLGSAGWSKDDEEFYVYSPNDIWSLSPVAARAPKNMTVNGEDKGIVYRMTSLDKDAPRNEQIVSGFNTTTKGNGYYKVAFGSGKAPVALIAGDFMVAGLTKSENGDEYLYTKETFEVFGNVWVTGKDFKNPIQLTDANPQQKDVNWGTTELVHWISYDGDKLDGVVYYPENFDPNKKYPLLVSFYERNSEKLYSHRTPELNRSTIDYHYYTSNGYIIFNPDIKYKDGFPGQSAFNSIMPGITSLINRGFIDEKAIGAQGHSWGGYQVAYLATRTDLFAAIESGAPVVNMLSAYGGIRWATGKNRSFQYEHQQSRIGGTIWEKPMEYIENSPIFFMDKVNTPILIMSNDQDGHVPWWQGIEYFVALKRLGKPTWLLNYTGEPHWPTKLPNKKDFQIRMNGFFDHYLKGEPMPEWMRDGIKATERDFKLKY